MSAAMRASQFSLSLVGRGARVHQRALEAPSQMRPKMEAMRLFHVPPETGQHHSSHHIIIITKLKCVHLLFVFFFFSLVLHLWEEGKPTNTRSSSAINITRKQSQKGVTIAVHRIDYITEDRNDRSDSSQNNRSQRSRGILARLRMPPVRVGTELALCMDCITAETIAHLG